MRALHRWLGRIAALFVLLLSVTGALLVFHDELDTALNPSLRRVHASTSRASLDAIVSNVQRAAPDCRITDILTRDLRVPERALTVRLRCGTEAREALVDPYSGTVLGLRDDNYFVGALYTLHSSLFLKDWGRLALLVIGLTLATTSVTGLLSHGRIRESFNTPIRRGLGARVALTDLHRNVGLAVVAFNVLMGVTGAWFTAGAVMRLTAGASPVVMTPPSSVKVSLDSALMAADTALPGFRVNWIVFPRAGGAPLGLWGEGPGASMYGLYGSTVNVDPETGDLIDVTDIRTVGIGAKLNAVAVPLHFGQLGGLPMRIVWSAAALGTSTLAVTGFVVWRLRRRRGRGPDRDR